MKVFDLILMNFYSCPFRVTKNYIARFVTQPQKMNDPSTGHRACQSIQDRQRRVLCHRGHIVLDHVQQPPPPQFTFDSTRRMVAISLPDMPPEIQLQIAEFAQSKHAGDVRAFDNQSPSLSRRPIYALQNTLYKHIDGADEFI